MTDLTLADLRQGPGIYLSPRNPWDVLIGDDLALPLTEASVNGDLSALKALLADPDMTYLAVASQHTIYDFYGANDPTGLIRVFAMPFTNLQRVIIRATISGHAEVVSMLFDFAVQNCGLKPMDLIRPGTITQTIRNGQAAVFDVLAKAEPTILTYDLEYNGKPIDEAFNRRQWGVVIVLLEHGVDARTLRKGFHCFSYRKHPLSLAAQAEGTRMAELLLIDQNFPIKGSGALHSAAELGRLDVMRLLLQHEADVNELLPEKGLLMVVPEDKVLYASWTPLHFAAAARQVEAMGLLKEHGADQNAVDKNGQTPSQLLAAAHRAADD